MRFAPVNLVLLALTTAGCAAIPLYPSRPAGASGAPVADPIPTKIVVHLNATSDGLRKALDTTIPTSGETTFEFRGPRPLRWERGPFTLRFADGRIEVKTELSLEADLPLLGKTTVPLQVAIAGEPIITSNWKARLQGATVRAESKDYRLRTAEGLAGALKTATTMLEQYIEDFGYDLSPQVTEAYQRVAVPIEIPVGEAKGCVTLRVTSLEAGPTVMAGGLEKDLALVVAPSVTLPCATTNLSKTPPPLSNVATLPSGPFTVTMPIAASYDELAKAMAQTFTDGKLFFSETYPELYLAKPEVYVSTSDRLVLKVHLGGPVKAGGVSATLDGDIYFAGHPEVVDNELRVPDLEPTIDTSNFLLGLKANLDGQGIRDQARAALKLDLGERLAMVRSKLSKDFAFGGDLGCLRADVAKIEVTGVYPHGAYLRVYVAATAQAQVHLPCPDPVTPVPVALGR